jgi:GNAT superfamily N-acetyltransferase
MPVTASGAHLRPIDAEVAAAFLVRLGEAGPGSIDTAVGAYEDNGTMIGVAVLGPSSRQRAWATVAVTRERRRLKVGSDLLGALLGRAAAQGLHYVASSHPVAALAEGLAPSEGLARSLGLITAHRVHQGMTTVVVVVPSET